MRLLQLRLMNGWNMPLSFRLELNLKNLVLMWIIICHCGLSWLGIVYL
uniref:Uncharacterized protein n=1 Tax=Picea sitchensis TaxID=3332 RepID=A9NQS9_PICSI|nr:unknown [Picea sitchensis]